MSGRRGSITIVLALLVAVMAAVGVGCAGGGDGGTESSTSLAPQATTPLMIPGEGGAVYVVDNLSSFSAKDPFKAQAVVTTTTTSSTTTTIAVTTTRSTTTTTRATTTTAPAQTTTTVPGQTTTTTTLHYLQLVVILSSPQPNVVYALDGTQVWGQAVGAVYDTGFVRIEVLAIDTGAGTATFRRGYDPNTADFTLGVGLAEYW
jgi:hypothetical protein